MSNWITVVHEETGAETQAHWTALAGYARRGWHPVEENAPEHVPAFNDGGQPDEATADPSNKES